MDQQPNTHGRKVFLLYPHSVIRDEMLDILIMAGYECYTLLDEKRARKLLVKFPNSIMFINIDAGLKENEWEAYIRDIQNDPQTADCRLGIMSYNQDKELMRKYLMDIAIPCGYVQLKLGLQESTRIILAALEANEARGLRKYIRAVCEDDLNAVINYKNDFGIFYGKILDISSAGLAARFEKISSLALNTLIKDVQLKLRGGLLRTDLYFMGQRHDNKNICIFIFDTKLNNENKLVIHHYIKQCLQRYIDGLKI